MLVPSNVLTRLAAAIAVLAATGSAMATQTQHGGAAMTCTNVASGTSWQIKIDYDKAAVDSNAAQISDAQISWHDASDGGNYTLDRKSGDLTVIVASSTGGYSLRHRCKPEN
jgi:hypothetical protein